VSQPRQPHVGAALTPRESRKHLVGRGTYIGDLTQPRMLHAAFVRSPHAHDRILNIDANAARRAPGVVAVLTGHDLAKLTTPLTIAPPIDNLLPMTMSTLLVDVEYDPLSAVVHPERAQDDGEPQVDDRVLHNRP
jgi:carbon-monoxide dehydrogenase large subunit